MDMLRRFSPFGATTVFLAILTLLLTACGGGSSSSSSEENPSDSSYSFRCDPVEAYSPRAADYELRTTSPSVQSTIIYLHGKNGNPYGDAGANSLYSELNAAGFDVIAIYMPYGGVDWDGSMCDALEYIDTVVEAERASGHSVFLAGHSMGGAHAFTYGVKEARANVEGLISLDPGHLLHQSNQQQSDSASSVQQAKAEVQAGRGDQIGAYITRNNSTQVSINVSANDYLSFHDMDQFPDMYDVLPNIDLPVLWLGGQDGSFPSNYRYTTLFDLINSQNSNYVAVDGDHLSMRENSSQPIVDWINRLSD